MLTLLRRQESLPGKALLWLSSSANDHCQICKSPLAIHFDRWTGMHLLLCAPARKYCHTFNGSFLSKGTCFTLECHLFFVSVTMLLQWSLFPHTDIMQICHLVSMSNLVWEEPSWQFCVILHKFNHCTNRNEPQHESVQEVHSSEVF